ncbi:hypothetical protein [Saccharopolyspora mangrovi]|uniref:Uncharacterized protein n=1 Tax=Saccharopolyspora mangrovi TaxID=3082379 RepID=A0ABU6AK19_9PSEU|nr:hypothetical protein [Saccharopolyspora sp. S2-29]MEB3371914.1 hypothetical protein [Saccharopolyspora sp. S2-29]
MSPEFNADSVDEPDDDREPSIDPLRRPKHLVPALSLFQDIVRSAYNPTFYLAKWAEEQSNFTSKLAGQLTEDQFSQFIRSTKEQNRQLLATQWPSQIIPTIERLLDSLERHDRDDVEEFEPSNWARLDKRIRMRNLLQLAKRGYPITWVPRVSVLELLLNASSAERGTALLDHRKAVLHDCVAVVSELRGTVNAPWDEQVELLDELVRMAESGVFPSRTATVRLSVGRRSEAAFRATTRGVALEVQTPDQCCRRS